MFARRHDARMRFPWQQAEAEQQLDLLGDAPASKVSFAPSRARVKPSPPSANGVPRMVATSQIAEDAANPRTEFPDARVDELAEDLRQRDILEPLVVHPVDKQGRYQLHFGAMRLRAAVRAGLHEVPVVIRDAPADRYAQVAENLKRHSLSPLELARFIRGQVDAGESQTTIAKRLGMNLTTVSHHLSLLELPPVLADVLEAGRCTSPRTLHELSKLHERHPGRVAALVDQPGDITREAVCALRIHVDASKPRPSPRLLEQAIAACDQLDKLLRRIESTADAAGTADERSALRAKVEALSRWGTPRSDGQTR